MASFQIVLVCAQKFISMMKNHSIGGHGSVIKTSGNHFYWDWAAPIWCFHEPLSFMFEQYSWLQHQCAMRHQRWPHSLHHLLCFQVNTNGRQVCLLTCGQDALLTHMTPRSRYQKWTNNRSPVQGGLPMITLFHFVSHGSQCCECTNGMVHYAQSKSIFVFTWSCIHSIWWYTWVDCIILYW